jgi:hypothetical protein
LTNIPALWNEPHARAEAMQNRAPSYEFVKEMRKRNNDTPPNEMDYTDIKMQTPYTGKDFESPA